MEGFDFQPYIFSVSTSILSPANITFYANGFHSLKCGFNLIMVEMLLFNKISNSIMHNNLYLSSDLTDLPYIEAGKTKIESANQTLSFK